VGLFRSEGELTGFSLLLLHGLSFVLVVFYVNMFQFWAWLSRQLGPGPLVKALPVLVTAGVLGVVAWRFILRVNRGHSINLLFFGAGIVCAVFALAIPDPRVPIKRIHVAEYVILAFLVRHTLSHRLQGGELTLFTFLVTILFGVHDEMLQGFHPLRYYGWRDIIVNATAGLSGALLGHGLLSFVRIGSEEKTERDAGPAGLRFVLYLLLFGAVFWLVSALYQQRGEVFSPLSWLPLVAISLLILFTAPGIVFNSRRHHGLQTVFWLASALPFYPLLARMTELAFL